MHKEPYEHQFQSLDFPTFDVPPPLPLSPRTPKRLCVG